MNLSFAGDKEPVNDGIRMIQGTNKGPAGNTNKEKPFPLRVAEVLAEDQALIGKSVAPMRLTPQEEAIGIIHSQQIRATAHKPDPEEAAARLPDLPTRADLQGTKSQDKSKGEGQEMPQFWGMDTRIEGATLKEHTSPIVFPQGMPIPPWKTQSTP